MIYQDAAENLKQTDAGAGPGEQDLEQIVEQSGLRTRPRSARFPTPSEVVRYSGKAYKVRAYLDEETAREYQQLISNAERLSIRCYGRVKRFLVLEYLESDADSSGNVLEDIPQFLVDLAAVPAHRTPDDDFRALCANVEASDIFRPATMEWVRGYYEKSKTLGIEWGLEYYDAMPRNFAYTEDGRPVSIDEKHIRLGPRGVSLVKMMEQLPAADFAKVKQAYIAKLGPVPFDESAYHDFLRFYRHLTALGALGAFRAREANIYEHSFHLNRQMILRISGAPAGVLLREEARWSRYWLHQAGRFFVKAWWFAERRVKRLLARSS
ncbi:MAG: hypothetical protein ACJ78Q_08255 [Chloroflexia bacterium]